MNYRFLICSVFKIDVETIANSNTGMTETGVR